MSQGHSNLVRGSLDWDHEREVERTIVVTVREDLRWVIRRKTVDGVLVEFSAGIQVFTLGVWRYMVRACTSHRNYHDHREHKLGQTSRLVVEVLDDVEQVKAAYSHAMHILGSTAEEEVARWSEKLS